MIPEPYQRKSGSRALGAVHGAILRENVLARVEVREHLLGIDHRRCHLGDEWVDADSHEPDDDLTPL